MATSHEWVAAPPSAVFESLMDPWTYECWVGGAKRIRDVDDAWPQPGSAFHHTVGVGPVGTRDRTVLLEAQPDERVQLEVHTWPGGEATVTLTLAADAEGTRITLEEQPTSGPMALLDNPLQQAALALRNDRSLAQLKRIVEHRWRRRLHVATAG